MSPTARRLYDLLPTVYRLRDAALAYTAPGPGGEPPMGPLQAVLALIAEQLDALQDDVEQLYDDLFIETCAEWVVPYIGDLIGARTLYELTAQTISQKAQVANTIHYRRRKGTVGVLQDLARDVTGWPARAVEYFQVLATTQYLNHLRPGNRSFADLRDSAALELIGSPFDATAHSADVRRIAGRRGRYNIPNIGLFLWRLQPFQISGGQPFEVTSAGAGLYTFSPLGLGGSLFNPAQAEPEFTHLAAEIDVPGPLRRRPLYEELEARRAALAAGGTPEGTYFGPSPVFQVFTQQPGGTFEPIDPADVFICDLSGWRRPGANGQVMVDPALGRLSFAGRPAGVRVNYTYGFGRQMGGGPYDRQARIGEWLPASQADVTFQRGVTKDSITSHADPLVATLGEAVDAWHTYVDSTTDASPFGIIAVMDSATYSEGTLAIRVPAGARLAIVAAGWPVRAVESGGIQSEVRGPGDLTSVGLRPVLALSIEVTGTPSPAGAPGGPSPELILDGLLIAGGVTVRDGDLARLRVSDCTLVPGGGGLIVQSGPGEGAHNRFLAVHLENAILGSVQVDPAVPTLEIAGSIVASGAASDTGAPAIAAAGATATISATTVFGTTEVRLLNAQDSIFAGRVTALLGQAGCVRYCYLSPGSRTPRPYRCQPERAADAAVADALRVQPSLSPAQQEAIRLAVRARVEPQFTSVRYGDPGYAQLSSGCAVEISSGADNDAELGAFHDLFQPQRETNLRIRLDEYLRFGLEAGIFYVT